MYYKDNIFFEIIK